MSNYDCLDCGIDTSMKQEYYMLHDNVWLSIVPDGKGMLCIQCAERRLGRHLEHTDFTDTQCNDGEIALHSPMLRMRIYSNRFRNGARTSFTARTAVQINL